MTEGQPGREMYMLTSGELEVLEGVVEGERRGHDAAKRLGFLSDGAFCALPIALLLARQLVLVLLCLLTSLLL